MFKSDNYTYIYNRPAKELQYATTRRRVLRNNTTEDQMYDTGVTDRCSIETERRIKRVSNETIPQGDTFDRREHTFGSMERRRKSRQVSYYTRE